MHYAIWALAYLAVSFVTSIGVGKVLAHASAAQTVPVAVRARGG